MEINDIIIASVTNLFRVYIIWRFVHLFFEGRKTGKQVEKGIYALFYIVTFFVFIAYHRPVFNVAVNIACLFGISLLYAGSLKKKIAVTVLIYSINMICDLLAISLFMNYISGDPTSQIFSIVTDLLILICELLAEKLLGKTGKQEYVRGLRILLVIPVLSILISYFLVAANLENRKLLAAVSVGILIINMVVFYLYHTLLQIYYQLREKDILEQKMQIYMNQIDVIEQTQKKIRILRHDMLHHIREMQGLAFREQKQELINYLNKMEEAMANEKEYASSGNWNIDGILNYMLEKAGRELKTVESKIAIPQDLNIDTFELTIILGNLLDNAIEAAKRTEEKKLSFKMRMEKGLLFIEISNGHDGKICVRKEGFITWKKDKFNHGLGLESVRDIVEKQNGIMNITYDEHNFKTEVMLYLSNMQ